MYFEREIERTMDVAGILISRTASLATFVGTP